MLDKFEKTQELIRTLEAAAPFEADLSSAVLAKLRQQFVGRHLETRQTVTAVHYAGDEGGIVCTLRPDDQGALVISLTHLQVRRTLPFSDAVIAYQKHRIKKIKKSQG